MSVHIEASAIIAADVQAFLSRGGQIEAVPRGAMAETGWTSRQRSSPSGFTRAMREAEIAEREAKKAKAGIVPAPRGTERLVRPVALKRQRVCNGPRIAQAGTQKARILALMEASDIRTRDVMAAIGITSQAAGVQLTGLCKAGLVVAKGAPRQRTWGLA